MVEEAVELARKLVEERYPQARAAWLGGSVARGTATATSDLDITVLLPGPPAPLRESLQYGGWPAELFVHTEESLTHYCEKDRQRRQPSMMRLVGETIVLLDTDGSGARLQESGKAQILAGPPPLSPQDLAMLRYKVSDLLEDLIGADSNDVRTAVAAILWQDAANLLLTGAQHWTGTGKGLLRELIEYDGTHATNYATALPAALRAAADGKPAAMISTVDAILAAHGGRLFAGFRLSGD
ncbi:nucleotidyltransferase domain-containing protein [Streptomyces sp. SID13031]|uniref:nucleotidyltransferase domain-containing protein n=1 Tax=Streptomyces sp. SID13031 TaxID=2706046 RepID=UPI0013CAB30A|nr:nucleotidyltransferase domain-containing protein [Streptomyces sp. SID13031]NEA32042.1 nucleotidyltransferase domain-containing protein [Streptomyces sp. SID13031]